MKRVLPVFLAGVLSTVFSACPEHSSTSCPLGYSECGDKCVDLDTDAKNCGACKKACDTSEVCVTSSCELNCPPGLEKCDDSCVNIHYDPKHCGACNKACQMGEVCLEGCVAFCAPGETICDGACVNLDDNPSYCGDCDTTCGDEQLCRDGGCFGYPNGFAAKDDWGEIWDGLQRSAKTWEEADKTCKSLGGRLPTVTELYRNNAATGTSNIASPSDVSTLWTLIVSHVQQPGRVSVSLSDGKIEYHPESDALSFRCVWPDIIREEFSGDACYGPPGAECRPNGYFWNVDAYDRPALSYPAAQHECNFYYASIPRARDLQEIAQRGMANPTNQWLWTSSGKYWYSGGYGVAVAKVQSNPQPNWDYDHNTSSGSYSWGHAQRNFRCIGKKSKEIGNLPSDPACQHDACFTITQRRSRLIADNKDRPAADWAQAAETCRKLGGSLPSFDEIGDLIQAGWENGSDAWMWAGQPVYWSDGTNGHYGTWLYKWSGKGGLNWFPINGNGAYFAGIAVTPSATQRIYRCIWHETFEDVSDPGQCGPGENRVFDADGFACKAVVKGTSCDTNGANCKAHPGGKEYLDAWHNAWDLSHREQRTYLDAKKVCESINGRLPTASELSRLVAAENPTDYLWTLVPSYQDDHHIVVRLSDGGISATNISSDTKHYFRCIWPASKGDVFSGSACHGDALAPCFQTLLGRYTVDQQDRLPLPNAAAAWECAFYGGRLPDMDDFASLVHAGAPNGSNNWQWLSVPAYWHSANWGLFLGRWEGKGLETWKFDYSGWGSLCQESDNRAFRCIYSDMLE